MKNILMLFLVLLTATGCQSGKELRGSDDDYCQYVNPFIGNADNGHTFPGATVPFGFIQVGPETGNTSWRYCSGYNYEDETVLGFAQNHLNGTGCSDLGDLLLLPYSGEQLPDSLRARIEKQTERAEPGYYAVRLPEYGVCVELTASQRTAFHRYTYHQGAAARMLLDLQSGVVWSADAISKHVLEAEMNFEDDRTITGHQEVRNWVQRDYFYVIRFDRPYIIKEELPAREGEKAKRLVLGFDLEPGESVRMKISLSSVSIEGAKRSMEAEIPDWDFDSARTRAYHQWNDLLSRVQVAGSNDRKVAFYTSLYHLLLQPNNIADTDGSYRGADGRVAVSKTGNYYSTLSLWDTYRAAHPLYTILAPERVDDLVHTLLQHGKTQGFLPIWALWGKENYCMVANHAVPVIVDAYLKGFTGFDPEEAYDIIKRTLTENHPHSDWEIYNRYGYYPFDLVPAESVSKTLESVYDDYCAARMAQALGKTDDYEYFKRRAGFYRNLFDPSTGLMRGKDSEGRWRTPFNPFQLGHSASVGGDFTEGNSWQYTWHVQHDPDGLIALMGGKEIFAAKLDSLFSLQVSTEQTGVVSDVSGLIGQYAHGNEPSHHVAYFYTSAGEPWKTQQLVREIVDRFYLNKPDGLCGNDDCGQMSAWYIFSAMGFYPVDPVSGEYVIGAPQVESVRLSLPGGKTFTVEAKDLSETHKYVAAVTLNGQPIKDYRIRHRDIMNGGRLVFTMANRPGNGFNLK